jgi:DNA invertase Pin-like site-specific DNA recombinase
MEKGILFLRVSTPEQEDKYGLDSQETMCVQYAKNNNIEVTKVWRVSESAWGKKERTAFTEMLDYAKSHPAVKHIVFDAVDRMTRNDDDKTRVYRLVQKHDKTVHFARHSQVIKNPITSQMKLLFGVQVLLAEMQSDVTSEKCRAGMSEKAAQGILPTLAPLGYLNVGSEEKKDIAIDEVNAPFVKKMFELVASGQYSLAMLEELLYAEGLRNRNNKKVQTATLHRIIHNPMYHGQFRWGEKLYDGKHQPLITKELWDAANRALASYARPYVTKHNFAFKGIMRCAECGCTILGEIQQKKYTYYHCSFSKGGHKTEYLQEHELPALFKPVIESISITEDISEWLKEGMEIKAKQEEGLIRSKSINIEAEYNKAKKQQTKLVELMLEEDANLPLLKEKERALRAVVADYEVKLKAESQSPKTVLEKAHKTINFIEDLAKVYNAGDMHEKGELLRLLGTYTLDNKKGIKPTFNEPFNIFREINEKRAEYLPALQIQPNYYRHQITGPILPKYYKYLFRG